jgi:hypothetical protein
LLLTVGFGFETSVSAPPHAVVYVDDAAKTMLAPQCADQYVQKAHNAALRRTTMGDARARHYELDYDCKETGAFAQPGPPVAVELLSHFGLWPKKTYWWDYPQPFRPEDAKAADAAEQPFVDCIADAAAAFDDGKRAVDEVAQFAENVCDKQRAVAVRYLSEACAEAAVAAADCKLDALVRQKEVALVAQYRAKVGVAALQARSR